jgi:hypothetical protein
LTTEIFVNTFYTNSHDGGQIMSRRKVGLLVLAVMVLGAVVPALLAPSPAEAGHPWGTWMVYTPNHPNGCAPMPYDCIVIFVYPTSP